jgi:hypothetical protein
MMPEQREEFNEHFMDLLSFIDVVETVSEGDKFTVKPFSLHRLAQRAELSLMELDRIVSSAERIEDAARHVDKFLRKHGRRKEGEPEEGEN